MPQASLFCIMKGNKFIFLIIALIMPVTVFVFLKLFGRNEFRVPVRYEAGNIAAPPNCDYTYTAPYRVADSVFTTLGLNDNDSLYVFYFDPSIASGMNRISVEFKGDLVQMLSSESVAATIDPNHLRECILLTKADSSVVLVDHLHRVRGYYVGNDRDEIDRLAVEMKIILKQY